LKLARRAEVSKLQTPAMSLLDSKRTVAELKELRALTGDADGAQRVAFTPMWVAARAWLKGKLEAIPGLETHTDAAGNFWATLRGESERALLIGGHLDSGSTAAST
jgi:N-carbamoyl-L-amino-acid hydrolase